MVKMRRNMAGQKELSQVRKGILLCLSITLILEHTLESLTRQSPQSGYAVLEFYC